MLRAGTNAEGKMMRILKFHTLNLVIFALALTFASAVAKSQNPGIKADLRSSAAFLTTPIAGAVLPTAPAGAIIVGPQTWVCDASNGFAPVIDTQIGVPDAFLAIGTQGNIKLPISSTTVPATCGQSALDRSGLAYATQAVVDTKNTQSTARGVLRITVD